jgi:hypothetical protein
MESEYIESTLAAVDRAITEIQTGQDKLLKSVRIGDALTREYLERSRAAIEDSRKRLKELPESSH